MSLLSLPNELLIRHIFSCNAISINDLKCMMISCHRLYKIIRESNELWRLKFLTRWKNFSLEKEEKDRRTWYEWTSVRLRVSIVVKETVESLSAIYHPVWEVPMSIWDELIEKTKGKEHPILMFVEDELEKTKGKEHPILIFIEDELRDLTFHQERNEALTLSYYASTLLDKLKRCRQLKNWQEFRTQQPSHKSLLKGAVLISLWFQNCFLEVDVDDLNHFIGLSEIEYSLESISQKVKQIFFKTKNATFTTKEFIDPIKNGRKLLDIINIVLFDEMSFHVTLVDDGYDQNLLSIDEVLETREGCPTILCIIYYEIARIMGIKCHPVYFGDKLLLRWQEYYSEDANSGSLFYIDVCDRGSLKHSVFYPAIIHKEPAAAVDIFRQMMHEFNQSVNEIIRTTELDYPVAPVAAFSLKRYQLDSVRLACAITPLQIPCINEYAELCIITGIDLNGAVQLLQSVGRRDDDSLIVRCKNELTKQQEEIDAAKIPCHRLPSIKYAVGLVMNYKYEDLDEDDGVIMRSGTCVITSWDDKFKESKEWTSGKGVDNLDQPFYHILLDDDDPGLLMAYFDGRFNVAEETLELHPTGVSIKHNELGNHFERFDGRKYVPNAEVRIHFPEDEAAALAIMDGI